MNQFDLTDDQREIQELARRFTADRITPHAAEWVDHRATVSDLIAIGRDSEAQVLARAVGWIAERRVLLNGKRTVVFR